MDLVRSSYWCYSCSRYIRVGVRPQDAASCPDCGGGFVEEMQTPTAAAESPLHPRFPAASMYLDNAAPPSPRLHRSNRDRTPFNPVIVLRSPVAAENSGNFELYYDDGTSTGLQPLPASVSEFLMGSGFDRLLDQLEINGGLGGRPDHHHYHHTPASKAAVESMLVVKIAAGHVSAESHCAVCKEAFELGSEAREMPCNHIYHSDCILPWLSLRDSCPVCRHRLPSPGEDTEAEEEDGSGEDSVGLTIWRLPGGGFAVGRFAGGRRAAAERDLPVVYTEMDGGFNTSSGGGAPRQMSWAAGGGGRARERGRVGRAFRRVFSFFGRLSGRSSSSSSSSSSGSGSEPHPRSTQRSFSSSIFGRSSRRRESHGWALDD